MRIVKCNECFLKNQQLKQVSVLKVAISCHVNLFMSTLNKLPVAQQFYVPYS